MLFSQRNRYKSIRDIIQKESMDDALRNRIWSEVCSIFSSEFKSIYINEREFAKGFIKDIWANFLKLPVDEIPVDYQILSAIRKNIFSQDWYVIYDFLEFVIKSHCINNPEYLPKKQLFLSNIEKILVEEFSAYRIINDQVTEITSELEIQSIEEAMQATDEFINAQQHLQTALKLMSDRQNPDYRNSIKESISAVESICKTVTNDDKATLGKALRLIDEKFRLHSALKESLSKLYGYTSDADGIRHALMEESTLTFIDAKFMLVACTNFINYLLVKVETFTDNEASFQQNI